MSTITNTTISSYDYLLRNYYSSNRQARKATCRSSLTQESLISADSDALKKIAANLREIEYSTDNGTNVYNNVKALVDSYNNLLESTDDTSSPEMSRVVKNLKSLLNDNEDALEEIGITISSSGELKLDKTTLASASPSKISSVLSADNDLTSGIKKYAQKINRINNTMIRTGSSNGKTTSTEETESSLLDLLTEETENVITSTAIDVKA